MRQMEGAVLRIRSLYGLDSMFYASMEKVSTTQCATVCAWEMAI